jgi:DNA-binding response OmpR family regulator
VLVVEDDEYLRTRLVELLAAKHHVRCAASGEEALAIGETSCPDILVTDLGLPGMDGLELTRRFRSLPDSRMTPVLVLTADTSIDRRLQGFAAGATDYVFKPFDPRELLARVEAQLALRALIRPVVEAEKSTAAQSGKTPTTPFPRPQ